MREFPPVEQSKTVTHVFWPSPQDYHEAVQTPASSFADEELRSAQVETTALGLPRSISGNFASVFCFHCKNRKVAVRCFLHNIADQQERYHAISQYVMADDLPCTVPVEYIEKGICIHGDWYPILKMEWVEGETLNQFVEKHLDNSMALNLLASYFKDMTLELRRHGIAHGDLQHDNIMISKDELRLVDYDGMFVPELSGRNASELGHANYQHPQRQESNFGPSLDNFSAWVIYTSLKALSRDPSLWNKLQGGADCLLFRHADFVDPDQSRAFQLLCNHRDETVRECAESLRELTCRPLQDVPCLDQSVESSKIVLVVSGDESSPAPPPQPVPRRQPQQELAVPGHGAALPDWLSTSDSDNQAGVRKKSVNIATEQAAIATWVAGIGQPDPCYSNLSQIRVLPRFDFISRDHVKDSLSRILMPPSKYFGLAGWLAHCQQNMTGAGSHGA